MNIKTTNLRFNLDKPLHRQAWEALQGMDKQRYKSYSQVIALALVEFFKRQARQAEDPYFETREREERFVQQILSEVRAEMERSLPLFLAGYSAGANPPQKEAEEVSPEVDWDFLGE